MAETNTTTNATPPAKRTKKHGNSGGDLKILHRLIRGVSGMAARSFFTEIRVIGGEKVPKTGPIIVTATHHNMMLDPVILSVGFPYARILNYWSKASLFANPFVSWLLYSSGNIPVDRSSKDRHSLFAGTFEALSTGQAVALFPEGTSYTEPRIMQIKDGAAWAALEYTKWLKEHPEVRQEDVVIVPTAIVYTNKSKYRSSVVMEFGNPIRMDAYKEQFLSPVEGASRLAVKRVTRALESELLEATINAPDWDTLYAARMARDIMWEKDRAIPLDEFVVISQTLVDLFSTSGHASNLTHNFGHTRRTLLTYYSLLQSTHLTNSVLSSLPLPRSLDPNVPTPLPSRLRTLFQLLLQTFLLLARLPFFLFPLVIHLPVYFMGRLGARLVEDEEETQAQNKVAFGLISLLMIYPVMFFILWKLFMWTTVGGVAAFVVVWGLAGYHDQMINANYESAKRLIAAWRVLVGIWAPKNLEFSIAALAPYMTPVMPKENPWLDSYKKKANGTSAPASDTEEEGKKGRKPNKNAGANAKPTLPGPHVVSSGDQEPPVKTRPIRRPPSRRIMRHVLRARIEAVKALAQFFYALEHDRRDSDPVVIVPGSVPGSRSIVRVKEIRASIHLARRFGRVDRLPPDSAFLHPSTSYSGAIGEQAAVGNMGEEELTGWRDVSEVISFLKARGGKIPTIGTPSGLKQKDKAYESGIDGEWAAALSDGEGEYSSPS